MDSLLTRAGFDDSDKELTGPTQVLLHLRNYVVVVAVAAAVVVVVAS